MQSKSIPGIHPYKLEVGQAYNLHNKDGTIKKRAKLKNKSSGNRIIYPHITIFLFTCNEGNEKEDINITDAEFFIFNTWNVSYP